MLNLTWRFVSYWKSNVRFKRTVPKKKKSQKKYSTWRLFASLWDFLCNSTDFIPIIFYRNVLIMNLCFYIYLYIYVDVHIYMYALPWGFILKFICFKRLEKYSCNSHESPITDWLIHHLFTQTDFQEKAEGNTEKVYCKGKKIAFH